METAKTVRRYQPRTQDGEIIDGNEYAQRMEECPPPKWAQGASAAGKGRGFVCPEAD